MGEIWGKYGGNMGIFPLLYLIFPQLKAAVVTILDYFKCTQEGRAFRKLCITEVLENGEGRGREEGGGRRRGGKREKRGRGRGGKREGDKEGEGGGGGLEGGSLSARGGRGVVLSPKTY